MAGVDRRVHRPANPYQAAATPVDARFTEFRTIVTELADYNVASYTEDVKLAPPFVPDEIEVSIDFFPSGEKDIQTAPIPLEPAPSEGDDDAPFDQDTNVVQCVRTTTTVVQVRCNAFQSHSSQGTVGVFWCTSRPQGSESKSTSPVRFSNTTRAGMSGLFDVDLNIIDCTSFSVFSEASVPTSEVIMPRGVLIMKIEYIRYKTAVSSNQM